jgi:TadE-like protein
MSLPVRFSTAQPRGRARQTGAAIVEFALVSPFALLFVLGIIQLGLMYSAKEVVNEGAFLAARTGAVENAQVDKMTDTMTRALVPFYQDTSDTTDITRLTGAFVNATTDTTCIPLVQCFLKLEILNPTSAAFDDFGITSSASGGHTYIPNDNLEYRSHSVIGPSSGLSIQDANALRIKVTYGYELKVPLMKAVFNAIMCGVGTGIDAFGNGNNVTASDDCTDFYSKGRVPLVSYATVQMQTPAWKPDN